MSTTAGMVAHGTYQSSWHYVEAETCRGFKGNLGWISKPHLKTPMKQSKAKAPLPHWQGHGRPFAHISGDCVQFVTQICRLMPHLHPIFKDGHVKSEGFTHSNLKGTSKSDQAVGSILRYSTLYRTWLCTVLCKWRAVTKGRLDRW